MTSAGRGRRSLAGLQALASTLMASPARLVVLDVGYSFVDDTAVEVMARGLGQNAVLRTLNLQGNSFGGKVREEGGNLTVCCCFGSGNILSF